MAKSLSGGQTLSKLSRQSLSRWWGSDKTVRLILSEDRCTLSSTGQKGANQIVTLVTTEKLKHSHTHKSDSDNLCVMSQCLIWHVSDPPASAYCSEKSYDCETIFSHWSSTANQRRPVASNEIQNVKFVQKYSLWMPFILCVWDNVFLQTCWDFFLKESDAILHLLYFVSARRHRKWD